MRRVEWVEKKILAALAVIAFIAFFGYLNPFALCVGDACIQKKADYLNALSQADAWMNPVLTKEEVVAVEWVKNNTPERTVFVSDIFGGELLMSSLREGTVGGDWAIVLNVTDRMNAAHRIYLSEPQGYSAEEAWNVAKKYNATYVWAPNRMVHAGYGWIQIDKSKFMDARFFEKVYSRNGMEVYKVK
jgi:hypothetical protein